MASIKTFHFLTVGIILTISTGSYSQEAFKGESLLEECRVVMPGFLNATLPEHSGIIEKYKDKELVRIRFSSESDTIEYSGFFIVSETDSTGVRTYVTTKAYINKPHPERLMINPRFFINGVRYYVKECFDSVMMKNRNHFDHFMETDFLGR